MDERTVLPRAALCGDSHANGGAGRTAVARRLRIAVDAGCEPGQMASRAHDLVLRDVRARPACARLRGLRSTFSRAVQFVLPRRRRSPSASRARVVRIEQHAKMWIEDRVTVRM